MREKVGVAHVAVAGIAPNRVMLNVQITEDQAHFEAAMAQDPKFKSVLPPALQNKLPTNKTVPTPLYYMWSGQSL